MLSEEAQLRVNNVEWRIRNFIIVYFFEFPANIALRINDFITDLFPFVERENRYNGSIVPFVFVLFVVLFTLFRYFFVLALMIHVGGETAAIYYMAFLPFKVFFQYITKFLGIQSKLSSYPLFRYGFLYYV
jgi:hypothetical protein